MENSCSFVIIYVASQKKKNLHEWFRLEFSYGYNSYLIAIPFDGALVGIGHNGKVRNSVANNNFSSILQVYCTKNVLFYAVHGKKCIKTTVLDLNEPSAALEKTGGVAATPLLWSHKDTIIYTHGSIVYI